MQPAQGPIPDFSQKIPQEPRDTDAPFHPASPSRPLFRLSPTPGYHLREIVPGALGELSKIQEELDELSDAEAQGSKVMMLVELADLYGALQLYLERHFSDVTMNDLAAFSAITRRAFENGRRASKQ